MKTAELVVQFFADYNVVVVVVVVFVVVVVVVVVFVVVVVVVVVFEAYSRVPGAGLVICIFHN
jgi:hypothetical protein